MQTETESRDSFSPYIKLLIFCSQYVIKLFITALYLSSSSSLMHLTIVINKLKMTLNSLQELKSLVLWGKEEKREDCSHVLHRAFTVWCRVIVSILLSPISSTEPALLTRFTPADDSVVDRWGNHGFTEACTFQRTCVSSDGGEDFHPSWTGRCSPPHWWWYISGRCIPGYHIYFSLLYFLLLQLISLYSTSGPTGAFMFTCAVQCSQDMWQTFEGNSSVLHHRRTIIAYKMMEATPSA